MKRSNRHRHRHRPPKKRSNLFPPLLILFAGALLVLGCEAPQPQLTEHQVDELLSMPAQSAAASRELVEHDAQAREAWLALYADIQSEIVRIGQQQDRLEAERKALAAQRRIDPIVAVTIEQVGLLAACLLPLLVLALLLWPTRPQQDHDVVSDYLVETIIDQRKLPRLEHKARSDSGK